MNSLDFNFHCQNVTETLAAKCNAGYVPYLITTTYRKIHLVKQRSRWSFPNVYAWDEIIQDYKRFYAYLNTKIACHGKSTKKHLRPIAYAFLELRDKVRSNSVPQPSRTFGSAKRLVGSSVRMRMKAAALTALDFANEKPLSNNPHFHAIYVFHPDSLHTVDKMIKNDEFSIQWLKSDTKGTHSTCNVQPIPVDDLAKVIEYSAAELTNATASEDNISDYEILLS